LIWSSEAIVAGVIDAFGDFDEPSVITLEAAPNIMLKRVPLKKLLSEWGIWVGYAPEGSLDEQQRSTFESLLDPSGLQIQPGRAIQADIPHSELRPEWTYPNSVRELTIRTASLSQPARTLAILLAYDQNPEQIAAAIPSLQEVQSSQVSPEDIQSLMASLSPALQPEFPELLAGFDFGQDQPHSSP